MGAGSRQLWSLEPERNMWVLFFIRLPRSLMRKLRPREVERLAHGLEAGLLTRKPNSF